MAGISLGDPSIGKLSESAMCTRKGCIRSETYRVTTAGIPCGMTCDPNYRARIELLVNPTGHGPSCRSPTCQPQYQQWKHVLVPHGGYTVPKSPTRYAHPAPSLDIRCRVTNAVPTAEHASDNLCGGARPYSRCLSNGNVPWYHTVNIPSLIHRPGTLTRPRHTIFARRAAPFFP